jgi:IS5 family transposase
MNFDNYFIQESYKKVQELGDKLQELKDIVDWERFRPMVASVYFDNKETGGRPHTDELVIVRALVLQAIYNLSDPQLEFQINDRLTFRNFVGFPDKVPDFTTIWKARERLKNSGKEKQIWKELQRQLKTKGYTIKKGVIQDAMFIEADPGKKRYQNEKKAKKNNKEIKYTEKQKQHIDKDGTYTKKRGQIHYGYKSHIKVDVDNHLVRDYEVTTASVHDTQVDLVKKGDVAAYRDKGYFGSPLKAKGVKDYTMKRGTRSRKLNGGEQKRNKMISRFRAPGERPFAVRKRIFDGGYIYVKTLPRVKIKDMFSWFSYNLFQLVTLRKKERANAING